MTAFDYALLVLLIGSMLLSFWRGLMKELISLASWFAAFFVATNYVDVLAPWLSGLVSSSSVRVIAAYILLFVGTRIAMMFLAKLVSMLISASGLTFMDRMLGAVFGLVKGVLIALVVILICGMTQIPQQPFWKNARLSPAAESVAETALQYMPDYIAKFVHF